MITRADGKKQTTFHGWPFYSFAGDKAANVTNDRGAREVWHVVTPEKIQPHFQHLTRSRSTTGRDAVSPALFPLIGNEGSK